MALADTHFNAEPLTADNLDDCRTLWCDRDTYGEGELERSLARVRLLLLQNRARGRIARDDQQRVRAYGVSVFVSDAVADRLDGGSRPLLGRQLLDDDAWDAAVLTTAQIGRANATGGLNLLVISQAYDDALPQDAWTALVGCMIQAFVETHQGFRVRRAIIEAFSDRAALFVAPAWPDVIIADVTTVDGGRLRTLRWTVTAAIAERQGGALLPLFLYRPPVLGLSDAEKAVLLAALRHGTDAAIARALGLSLSSVKSRWSRIFRRIADTPLGRRIGSGSPRDKRGPQTRLPASEPLGTHTVRAASVK